MSLSLYAIPQYLAISNSKYGSSSPSAMMMVKCSSSELRPTKRGSGTGLTLPTTTFFFSESETATPPQVTSVPVRVAHELLQAGHRYLDVRTREEFSAGHVVGAVNVPFMLRLGEQGMRRNPRFVEEVLNHFSKYDEIIVGCQIGKRSFMAASDLLSVGFSEVTDMAGGYAVWVQNRLPTTPHS